MGTLTDRGFDVLHASLRGYYRVFAESRAAERLSRPSPVRFTGFDRDVTVVARDLVAEDVVALTLAGDDLPTWSPGAHLDVFLPSGTQRQYSLCGDPTDSCHYRIAVRLLPTGGGGSREVHERVAVGDTLRVRGPRQAFHLVPESSYLFVAAGIGITPILPMVAAAEQRGARWRLAYLGRSRATMPFLDELAAYGDRVEVRPDEEAGPPDLDELLALAPPDSCVFMCGPTPLMDRARALLPRVSPGSRLHTERFSAPPVRGGEPFTLRLARSGREIAVGAQESTLTALRREVPGVAYSCQQGFCGTCEVTVLDGAVDRMLPCLARGTGTVTIDL